MSIDQDADSEQHLARWLKKHWIRIAATVIALAIVGVAVCFTIRGWGWLGSAQAGSDSNSAVLRNISLVAAGVVSVGLVFWRNKVASRQARAAEAQAAATSHQATATEKQARATIDQAKAMEDQTESIERQTKATLAQVSMANALTEAEIRAADSQTESNKAQTQSRRAAAREAGQRISESQFQRGEELLLSEQIAARVSGIEVLRRLGLEAPEPYPSRVVHLLCTFIRHSSLAGGASDGAPEDRVRAAISATGAFQRLSTLDGDTDTRLDFTDTRLDGARFEGVNLSGAIFIRADLSGTVFESVDLTDARLEEATLEGTGFSGSNLTKARLSNCSAYLAYFVENSNLTEASLRNARLAGANFKSASLIGTNLTAARFVPHRDEYPDLAEFVDYVAYDATRDIVAEGLTQEQLDAAVADPEHPPLLDGLEDAETGEPLVWRGEPPPDTSS